MSKLKIFAIVILIFAIAISTAYIKEISSFSGTARVEENLIKINGKDLNNISLNFNDTDGDGAGDTALFEIQNNGDMTLEGRIVELEVKGNGTDYLIERTGNGTWSFYEDSDNSGNLTENDVKIGEIKIMQGSDSLNGDLFKVGSGKKKEIKVMIRYEPYAEKGDYSVGFKISVIPEKYQKT